jgi:hypothetical protein
MYLPLVTLAFFTRPFPAALTSFLIPLISGALTGMPPFYPPVAFLMSIEISMMSAIISSTRLFFPRLHELVILVPVLILGRAAGVGLIYLMSLFMKLPAKFVAGASILSGCRVLY